MTERAPVLDAIGHTPIVRLSRGETRRVATVLVDSGLKYLGGSLLA